MVNIDTIRELAERIVHLYHPQQVILFGSHAYGVPTAGSDVDLLIILPCEEKSSRKAVEILNAVNPPFPVDLLVRTPEQVRQRLAWNDFFLQEIMTRGKVLYEAAHP
jgi:uncharacterized protein